MPRRRGLGEARLARQLLGVVNAVTFEFYVKVPLRGASPAARLTE